MRAFVVVAGAVDERDVWPYAVWSDSDGTSTTLTVRVHDSQELVGVLSALTALGLDIVSTRLTDEPGVRGTPERPRRRPVSLSESDVPDRGRGEHRP